MAKKAVNRSIFNRPPRNETELRRWCIEMAAKWPTDLVGGGVGGGYGLPGHVGQRVEQDVIGRAKRLLDWVKATS